MNKINHWTAIISNWRPILLAILLIIVDYYRFLRPNFKQYNGLLAQEMSLKREFEKQQRHAATLQEQREQLARLSKQYNTLLKQFSTQSGLSTLLEKISKAGTANGLIFELFAPLPEIISDFYIELPIKMTVRGHYQQLALFLNQVAQLRQIVTFHDFELLVFSGEKQRVNVDNVLVMKIMAKIYHPL